MSENAMSRDRTAVSRFLIWVGAGLLVVLGWTTPAAAGQAGEGAWADDLSPITAADWDQHKAAHLLERAGFGGTPDDVARLAAMTPEAAVASLVDYHLVRDTLSPFDASPIWDPAMDPFPNSRAEAVRRARETGESMGVKILPEGESRRLQPVVNKFFYGLRSNAVETQRLALWWGQRMLLTTRPLEEKLTLFWHGHFATGNTKVRDTRMMLRQNEMLRAGASGSFRDLLLGILTDPAMLVYLDNRENIKDHPNENFGRELLELFTMGVGNYSELDIREASRAFTGWTNDVLEFQFEATQHDYGPKTFLGQTGLYDGTDIIDLVLDQHPTAEFIAGKLYRYFVRQDLSDSTQAELGATLRDANYELSPLLARIFLSRDFYSAPSFATPDQEPRPPDRVDLSQAGAAGNADDPRFQPAHRQPGPDAVQPSERSRMGRGTDLDHAWFSAPEGQPLSDGPVCRRRFFPRSRPRRSGHLRERRSAARTRDEHHGRHAGRRCGVEHAGRPR